MKLLNKLLILLIISINCAFGYQGELRFFIDDDYSSDYKIIANRYDLNSPLFGIDFMMIEGNDYNEVTSDDPGDIINPNSNFDFWLGFDYVRDQGSYIWPFIGEGKYEFTIKRNDEIVFRFKIDLLHYTGSPEIDFEYIHSIQKLTAYADSRREVIYNVQFDEMLYSWLILNEERDITAYENEVEITNLGNGKINPSLNIKLENADMGFPYINYSVGTEFNTSQHINVWRGAFYTLSVVQPIFTRNDTTFSFRHWDNYNVYNNPSTLKILSGTDKIRTIFYPTHQLTVTNYLEGGTSTDDFQLTWQDKFQPQNYDYGIQYDAFLYEDNEDQYTIEALPITEQRYGTNWTFLNWNTGSASTTLQNIKMPDDIPSSGSFTANYKGHFTSAQSDAFTSNGQRKIVLDSQGKYHIVYPSYGKIWGTSSEDLYVVGNGGNIAHYSGPSGGWQKIESGTETIINDAWGFINKTGEVIVYCPVSSFFVSGDKKIIKLIDGIVDSVNWSRDIRLYSFWGKNENILYSCGEGVYEYKFGNWQDILLIPIGTNSLRGTEVNDIFIAGDFGVLFHFNGWGWQMLSIINYDKGYSKISVTKNMFVVCGYHFGKALLEMGRRN
ncbi:MAG: hypothetical protein IPJ03_08055 [Ignavibacteriales bacterium]|nr:hypothetical protein [Ignavibacteriales bacterium]